MVYLIILLLITHIATLYFINKYIKTYKLNNYNYLDAELKNLKTLFVESLKTIAHNAEVLTDKTAKSLEKLEAKNTGFIKTHQSHFNEVTTFIKEDYTSLTKRLSQNNKLLLNLLHSTQENILKNTELTPILINSNLELEKVYGKIKQLMTTYEKSLNDIKNEMGDVLYKVETTIDGKIKQLASSGEKTMLDAVAHSETTILKVTEETNNGLRTVLKENQIKVLTEQIESLNTDLSARFKEVLNSVNDLDNVIVAKLQEENTKEGDKKGFFNF